MYIAEEEQEGGRRGNEWEEGAAQLCTAQK